MGGRFRPQPELFQGLAELFLPVSEAFGNGGVQLLRVGPGKGRQQAIMFALFGIEGEAVNALFLSLIHI